MAEAPAPPAEAPAAPGRGTLASRALGGSILSVIGFGGGQIMRLASNLVLTRILAPQDFGLMTLVTSFLVGLMMFSDMGLGPSIQQSKRGDDPAFLDTAWTIKVIRGAILLGFAVAIAWPLSIFYQAPQLAEILPVAAISLFVAGFNPTRIDTATRHLVLGRLTVLELAAQFINIGITVAAAWWLKSVWALAIGNISGALVLLLLTNVFLPGHANRFRMEPAARAELITFGKWIFLSTICGFMLAQGDRVILGRVLTLDQLGIYNIGLFLGSIPTLLGGAVANRLLIPMYRDHPPGQSHANFRTLARARAGVTVLLCSFAVILALIGPWIADLLYDERYVQAGGILVVIAILQFPQILVLSYDYSALAAGDTRRYFFVQAIRFVIYTTAVLAGAWFAGLPGLLVGQGLAYILGWPVIVWVARKHHAWDPRHDLAMVVVSVLLGAVAVWMHSAEIVAALAGG